MKTSARKTDNLTPEEIKKRNIENYGKKIKNFRTRAGMSAELLSEKLGVSKGSVRNWECGISRPDPEYLFQMFRILDVEPNEFFGIGGVGTLLTEKEKELIENYRSLDEDGREDASAILDVLSRQAQIRKTRDLIKAASNKESGAT